MPTKQGIPSLLSEIGVTRAREMIDSTLVHLVIVGGSEVCEIVREAMYLPPSPQTEGREKLVLRTKQMSFFFIRKKNMRETMVSFKFSGKEYPFIGCQSLTVGELEFDVKKV